MWIIGTKAEEKEKEEREEQEQEQEREEEELIVQQIRSKCTTEKSTASCTTSSGSYRQLRDLSHNKSAATTTRNPQQVVQHVLAQQVHSKSKSRKFVRESIIVDAVLARYATTATLSHRAASCMAEHVTGINPIVTDDQPTTLRCIHVDLSADVDTNARRQRSVVRPVCLIVVDCITSVWFWRYLLVQSGCRLIAI